MRDGFDLKLMEESFDNSIESGKFSLYFYLKKKLFVDIFFNIFRNILNFFFKFFFFNEI